MSWNGGFAGPASDSGGGLGPNEPHGELASRPKLGAPVAVIKATRPPVDNRQSVGYSEHTGGRETVKRLATLKVGARKGERGTPYL